MKKGKLLLRWAAILGLAAIVSFYCIGTKGFADLSKDSKRADAITIDTLKIFGDIERPEVVFLHDLHTDALEKKKKDCSVCHLSGSNYEVIPDTLKTAVKNIDQLSPKFKRLKDISRKEVMDIYHNNCIECHTTMTAEGDKSGPVACGDCHKKDAVSSSRLPMGFDKSLHFRHSKAQEKKCEQCHHEYDGKAKKLVYVKEKEGSCRFCHMKETEENRISMKLASHLSCIDCHRKKLAKKIHAGPVKCAGCHDAEHQKKIEKVTPVPRMERKQPDSTLITTDRKDIEARMNFVPFDHKAHEEYNDTCRVCHHADMEKCSKCHTLAGKKEGNNIRLEQAMHQPGAEKTCTGCHEIKQDDKKCAGCHVFMQRTRKKEASSCLACHMNEPEVVEMKGQTGDMSYSNVASGSLSGGGVVHYNKLSSDKLTEKELAQAASLMLKARKPVTGTFEDEKIPEKVVIKDMADKYGPVDLPHRKIVLKLVNDIKDNKLANYFHSEKGTVCQGCHHNSPVSEKPPRCVNCHGKPFDESSMFKPGLMGAYHIQCMGCHKEMGLEKPVGCTDCHKEKKF
ncbi:MAG: cytochrome c3 family protein [Desulfobacteraceae bacterium]|nr:cytochrome c3 family protein [Desulfobacteraceae bacterium]